MQPCDGMDPRSADDVTLQLIMLGYTEFNDAAFGGTGIARDAIITSQEDWDAMQSVVEGRVSQEIDWEKQVVFLHQWTNDGCEEYDYFGFRWEDTVRLRALKADTEPCDLPLPVLTFIIADAGGADDLGWCE